jgi:SpoVK/Ycf46/Vps4 family AAA+-type ATPase
MKQDITNYFHIIQKLIREAMSRPDDDVKKQIKRLSDELLADGYAKESKMLNNILLASSSKRLDINPIKLSRSGLGFSGEELTKAVQLPVNKENGAQIVDIKFVNDLPESPPLFSDAVIKAISSILQEWNNVEKLTSKGMDPVRSCLIYGAPGTGKTQLALWMARQLNLPVVTARLDGLMSSYLGTTSKNIGNLFEFANRYKCLLLLDEFDAIAKFRADSQEIGEIKRVVNTLLQNMDMRKQNGFTIGITNHQGLLDPAVWRRFDLQIEIPVPNREVLEKIIADKLAPIELRSSQVKFLSWLIEGRSGADAEVLTRWVKKARIVAGSAFDSMFYNLIQEFIFLNAGRVNSNNAKTVMQDDRSILKETLSNSIYKFKGTEISDILWVNKSTVSKIKIPKRK